MVPGNVSWIYVLLHEYVYRCVLLLKGMLSWPICWSPLGKVAWVTADTVLLQWINNLETSETFKCSVVLVDAVAQTASAHRWDQIGENVQKKMGGIENLPDDKLLSSHQSKAKSVLPCCCCCCCCCYWYVWHVSEKQEKLSHLDNECDPVHFSWIVNKLQAKVWGLQEYFDLKMCFYQHAVYF